VAAVLEDDLGTHRRPGTRRTGAQRPDLGPVGSDGHEPGRIPGVREDLPIPAAERGSRGSESHRGGGERRAKGQEREPSSEFHVRSIDRFLSQEKTSRLCRTMPGMLTRCPWGIEGDPLYLRYHDEEWGVPSHDDRHLLEMLILEGAQAGLSWATILRKREGYRRAFRGFDPERMARFAARDVDRLLQDRGIVRNRAKVEAAVANARATLKVAERVGSLDAYLWRFVDGQPLQGARRRLEDLPTDTPESRTMSRDLKREGFRFVGPVVCYSFMQAVGMVNDHLVQCFRYREVI